MKRVSFTNRRRWVPFFLAHCLQVTMSQLCRSLTRETWVEKTLASAASEGEQSSPFDIGGELLVRGCHIFLPDFHRFHEHPAQSFQIFYRHLKNVSLPPLFPTVVCLFVALIQILFPPRLANAYIVCIHTPELSCLSPFAVTLW